MSTISGPPLTLRTPPRYGRRAVWSILAALGLFGLSFAIDAAAANQIGYSEMPAIWARYLAAVALYHDCSEILTGALPTPIKYHSREIRAAYSQVEELACEKLLATLPE